MDRMDLSESDKSMRDERPPKSAAAPFVRSPFGARALSSKRSSGSCLGCSFDGQRRYVAPVVDRSRSPCGNVSRRGDLQSPRHWTAERFSGLQSSSHFLASFPGVIYSRRFFGIASRPTTDNPEGMERAVSTVSRSAAVQPLRPSIQTPSQSIPTTIHAEVFNLFCPGFFAPRPAPRWLAPKAGLRRPNGLVVRRSMKVHAIAELLLGVFRIRAPRT